MSTATIKTFPPESKVWVFALRSPMSPAQETAVGQALEWFVSSWAAHKQAVRGEYEIRYQQFIVIAANEELVKVSGCSTDSLFREVRRVVEDQGLSLADINQVVYRDGELIKTVDRSQFRSEVQAGSVTPDTVVFNNTITSVGELTAGKWELPLKDSWHAKVFIGDRVHGT